MTGNGFASMESVTDLSCVIRGGAGGAVAERPNCHVAITERTMVLAQRTS